MNIILVAPPAAGKGTIASLLNEKYGLVGVSAGELLRGVDRKTELGKQIDEIQSKGLLVTDEITNKLMEERLLNLGNVKGFILDGYPRRMNQVYGLDEIQKRLNLTIDYVIYLKADYETVLKRTIGRRICPACKSTYNVLTGVNAPLDGETCDKCHVALTQRNDDTEENIKIRYESFKENALPVVEYYRNEGKLLEIDATKDINEVLKDLEKSLGENR